jgi:transcriptional regulator with XRE-family HTH domain
MPQRRTSGFLSATQVGRHRKTTLRNDAKKRRPWTYRCSSDTAYRHRMSDAPVRGENWAGYLRRMTKRPGWSVAKLARDSGIHRGTIFKWLSGDTGVTIDSVRRIAHALGDDPDNALRAAGNGGVPATPQDEEVDLIMRAPVDDDLKQTMLRKLAERRERDRQRRLEDFQEIIDLNVASRGED